MDNLVYILLGSILGAVIMYWLFNRMRVQRNKELAHQQSTVLLEQIRSVCKLITVEGDFAEIYKYESTKERFMSLVNSKKKALVVINARAQIGYDLKKVLMHADTEQRKIILTNFPEPEVLSIEPELQFYDIMNGLFNTFSPDDLTNLNIEAKQHIRDKIPQSGLMQAAQKEARETVLLIEKIVETIGWHLDYTTLEIRESETKIIDKK